MTRTLDKPLAEVGEEIASGRTGVRCPFCDQLKAAITTRRDRRGVSDQWWDCEGCDEGGPIIDGVLHWLPEGEVEYA